MEPSSLALNSDSRKIRLGQLATFNPLGILKSNTEPSVCYKPDLGQTRNLILAKNSIAMCLWALIGDLLRALLIAKTTSLSCHPYVPLVGSHTSSASSLNYMIHTATMARSFERACLIATVQKDEIIIKVKCLKSVLQTRTESISMDKRSTVQSKWKEVKALNP